MKAKLARIAAVSGAALASASAFAVTTPPDLTSLTSSVDLSTTLTAVLAIAATLATLYVGIRAAKTVLGMIRGR